MEARAAAALRRVHSTPPLPRPSPGLHRAHWLHRWSHTGGTSKIDSRIVVAQSRVIECGVAYEFETWATKAQRQTLDCWQFLALIQCLLARDIENETRRHQATKINFRCVYNAEQSSCNSKTQFIQHSTKENILNFKIYNKPSLQICKVGKVAR